MTRADAWIHFAAGALADPNMLELHAAEAADKLLEMFDRRFEPTPYGRWPAWAAPDTFQEKAHATSRQA